MTKVYRGLGLACTYPENWQLSEETAAGNADQPTVVGFNLQSPTSAFMSVYRYPRNVSPDEAIEEATKAIAADYDGIELSTFEPQRELIHAELDPSQPSSNVSKDVSNSSARRTNFAASGFATPLSQAETEAREIPKTSPTCCSVRPLASLSERILSLSMTNDINRSLDGLAVKAGVTFQIDFCSEVNSAATQYELNWQMTYSDVLTSFA